MNPELKRKKKIKALCDLALDLDVSARVAFLDQACDGDLDLRREVESLIRHENGVSRFMARPAWQHVVSEMACHYKTSLEGRRLGQYQLRQRIGKGGMGEVWWATDQRLKREVAIKILPPAFSSDVERVRRFEREAHAVSALKHPNIITIHEIGQSDDLHFIVTELVEGRTLRDQLLKSSLGWREAVLIAAQIAGALNAAHTAGIIHRDIKPENVIVQPGGQVKLLDFGIAKWVGCVEDSPNAPPETEAQTLLGATPGTLKYMSPEQSRGERLDPRTDIFSLGLVLCEMIAGSHPYSEIDEDDAVVALRSEDEIAPLDADGQIIPTALAGVVARALRKNRDERYASACEMLADLDQLKSLIEVSRTEKGQKLFRSRNANELLTQYAVLYDSDNKTRMPLGTLWTIWRFAGLKRGRLEREIIRKSLVNAFCRIALLAIVTAGVTMAVAAAMSVTEKWEERIMRDGHTAAVRQAIFSPDGRLLVSVGEDAKVFVWDFAGRQRIAELAGHSDWITSIAFSPDGKWFATGSHDHTVIVWDAARLEKTAVLKGHQDIVTAVAFSPNGKWMASATRMPQMVLWDTSRWEIIREVEMGVGLSWGNLHFSPDSRRLLASNGAIVDVATGERTRDEALSGNWAAISSDFKRRVTTDGDGHVKFFLLDSATDLRQWKLISLQARAHRFHGRGVAFSPDGKLVATSADDIIVWDAATQEKITRLSHTAEIWWLAFSPDGKWLVSTHADGAVLLWDVVEREAIANFNGHHGSVRAVAFSSDGRRLASTSEDRSIVIWNSESGKKDATLVGHDTRVTAVRFSQDGRKVVSCDQNGSIKSWDLESRRPFFSFAVKVACYDIAVSTTDPLFAATSGVYSIVDGRQVMDFWPLRRFGTIYAVDFTQDGLRLAFATENGNLGLIDTNTWQVIEVQESPGSQFTVLRFSADGRSLVTGETEGSVKLWSTSPLREAVLIGQHAARVKSAAFSPDGSEIISASEDQTIALWDVQRRKLVSCIGTHAAPVLSVAFTPDGRQIVSGEGDHSVRIYARHRSLWGFRLN